MPSLNHLNPDAQVGKLHPAALQVSLPHDVAARQRLGVAHHPGGGEGLDAQFFLPHNTPAAAGFISGLAGSSGEQEGAGWGLPSAVRTTSCCPLPPPTIHALQLAVHDSQFTYRMCGPSARTIGANNTSLILTCYRGCGYVRVFTI